MYDVVVKKFTFAISSSDEPLVTALKALHASLSSHERAKQALQSKAKQKIFQTVCLSVRSYIKRVDCDKTEESSAQIFILYERSFILVF